MIATAVEPICIALLAPIRCTICPPIKSITIEPIEAVLNNVPKVPLFTFKLAFKSGVRGASDIIDKPNRKNM
ncbi:unannotated protein [freshwater metagenome]|uniref:Unannotated protein n=1 Tax=freshwater metagenome TaxID=449393 RepID=A0A6J6N3V2_9ZZZZ